MADRTWASPATRPLSHSAGSDSTSTIIDLAEQLRTTARAYSAALAAVEPLAKRLADLEAQLRAAKHQAGVYDDAILPPTRELAADVALGHLQALRPFVSFVSKEALTRADRALMRPAAAMAVARIRADSSGE